MSNKRKRGGRKRRGGGGGEGKLFGVRELLKNTHIFSDVANLNQRRPCTLKGGQILDAGSYLL